MSDSDNDMERKRESIGSALSPINSSSNKNNVDSSEGSEESSSSESSSEESNVGTKTENAPEMEWSLESFIKPDMKKVNQQNEMPNNNLLAERCASGGSHKDSDDEKDSASSGSNSNSPHGSQNQNNISNLKPESPSTAEENESAVPELKSSNIKTSNSGALLAPSSASAYDKHFTPNHADGKTNNNNNNNKNHIDGVESDDINSVLKEVKEMRPTQLISSLDSDSDANHSGSVLQGSATDPVPKKVKVKRPSKSARAKVQQIDQDNSSDDENFSSSNPPKNQKRPNQEKKGRGRPRKQPKEQFSHNAQPQSHAPATSSLVTAEQGSTNNKKTPQSRAPPTSGNRKGDSKTVGRRRGSRQEIKSRETITTESSSSEDEARHSGHRSSSSQYQKEKRYSPPQKTSISSRIEDSRKSISDSSDGE